MGDMFRMLPSGNIEMTVAITPDAYAALREIGDRDKVVSADAVSLALMTLNEQAKMMEAAGMPLRGAMEGQGL